MTFFQNVRWLGEYIVGIMALATIVALACALIKLRNLDVPSHAS